MLILFVYSKSFFIEQRQRLVHETPPSFISRTDDLGNSFAGIGTKAGSDYGNETEDSYPTTDGDLDQESDEYDVKYQSNHNKAARTKIIICAQASTSCKLNRFFTAPF